MEKFNLYKICLTILLLGLFVKNNAQITITQNVDIKKGIEDSLINVSISPDSLQNDIIKLFDGEPFTEIGINDGDSIIITLIFDTLVNISKTKVFFVIYPGEWSLEAAKNETDLINQSESYISIINNKPYNPFTWDSVAIEFDSLFVYRLTIRNLNNNIVHIGEWVFESEKRLVSLLILPNPPRLLPGTELNLEVGVLDEENNLYEYNFDEPLFWSSSNTSVASFNNDTSILTGNSIGTSEISVSMQSKALEGSAIASVENDFVAEKVPSKVVKVALIIQDPIIPQFGNKRIHEKWNWSDPNLLIEQLQSEFYNASDGTVIFEIVETHQDQNIFTMIDTTYMTIDTLAYYFKNSYTLYTELKNLAETQGRIHYDYSGLIDFYDLDTKRNNGIIDEVWVYAFPFGGMYESILCGPGAFWWNSPPLPYPGLDKTLSIMGWNYERGIPEAMESMGHRFESAIWHAFGRWDNQASNPNSWEIYTRIDKDNPGKAHIGNIHYPPNGMSDYDFANSREVITYADTWKRFPYLLNQTRIISCTEWGCSHLGYMRWWFSHLPRFKGVYKGILNNWWAYALDYYDAIAIADSTPIVGINDFFNDFLPNNYMLYQNYPNPFNPSTVIRFELPIKTKVELKIYDILGELINSLVDEEKQPGRYEITWDGKNFLGQKVSSGIYFYRLKADNFNETKKMILLK